MPLVNHKASCCLCVLSDVLFFFFFFLFCISYVALLLSNFDFFKFRIHVAYLLFLYVTHKCSVYAFLLLYTCITYL